MPFPPTPSQTASNTPTPSITASITPTITPTLTSCPDSCCFANYPGSTLSGAQITDLAYYIDGQNDCLLSMGNVSAILNGQTWRPVTRFDSCGNVLSAYTFAYAFLGVPGATSSVQLSNYKIGLASVKNIFMLEGPSQSYAIDTSFNYGYPVGGNDAYPVGIARDYLDRLYVVGFIPNGWQQQNPSSVVNVGNTNIIRLLSNGYVDTSYSGKSISNPAVRFNPGIVNDNDGKIILYSFSGFTDAPGQQGVIRLNVDGTLDTSFSSTIWDTTTDPLFVNVVKQLPNGQYYVGGAFRDVAGNTNQDYLIRINNDGTLDTTFDYQGTTEVFDIIIQDTGKIVIMDIDNDVRRINSDGSFDSSFYTGTLTSTGIYDDICAIELPYSKNIIIGGPNMLSYNDTITTQTPAGLIKITENGLLSMCPDITPTPSMTQTPSQTPTIELTPTATPTSSQTPTIPISPSATPTLTPSPTQCLCFSSVTIDVTVAGNVTFNDCYGNPTIEDFLVGNGQTYGDGTFCIQKDTNGGTAEYTIVSYNDCCVPITPTPSATPTMTPSPSSSGDCFCYYILNETASPGNYTYTICGGSETTLSLAGGANVRVCSSTYPVVDSGLTAVPCVDITYCSQNSDCTGCNF